MATFSAFGALLPVPYATPLPEPVVVSAAFAVYPPMRTPIPTAAARAAFTAFPEALFVWLLATSEVTT